MPAVVQAVGSLPERVVDGVTGIVARDDERFAAPPIALLTDDALWRARARGGAARARGASAGTTSAQRFEALMP